MLKILVVRLLLIPPPLLFQQPFRVGGLGVGGGWWRHLYACNHMPVQTRLCTHKWGHDCVRNTNGATSAHAMLGQC